MGSVAFVLDYSPLSFVWSGLRWLLLLHASFGLFLLSKSFLDNGVSQRLIAIFCLCIGVVDLAFALQQLSELGIAYGATFAETRVTGFFGHAGPAAFFGFAMALICLHLDRVSFPIRFSVSAIGFLIALSTGTRSIVIFIFMIIALQFFEFVEVNRTSLLYRVRKIIFLPLVTAAAFVGYGWLIAIVDRGDLVGTQLEEGGRVANAVESIKMLYSAEMGELIFGRGLGIGTNTAYGQLLAAGVTPEFYRFNFLVDNAILTTFFQFGLLGSIWFWSGIVMFVASARPKLHGRASRRYWTTCAMFLLILWAGNPFEQYYLMLSFATSLGCAYWASVAATSAISARAQI